MKKYCYYFPLITTVIAAAIFLKGEFSTFIIWWASIVLCGIIFMPAGIRLFKQFNDKGYLFSKALGILSATYLLWLLSSLGILPFSGSTALLCLVVIGFLFILLKWGPQFITFFKEPGNVKIVLLEEALFFICLLFWTMLRGQKPEISGLEKYMDFGFMNSILRTPFAPPSDMWMAGSPINYYYFGQYISAFLTALTGTKPAIAYNLMMSTLFALTFVLCFSLIFNTIRAFYPINPNTNLKNKKKYLKTPGKATALLGGLISAMAVSLSGNLHSFVYSVLLPLGKRLGFYEGEVKKYWFPEATRYIGHNPSTNDKTIHEFPLYSFVVSDLHAHVVNIIFVLTILAILFVYLMKAYSVKPSELSKKRWFIPEPELVLAGFLIGIFHMSNYWDFPIYFTVTLITLLIVKLRQYGFKLKLILATVFNAAMVILVSKVTALPFTLNFIKMAGEIKLAQTHTFYYQLLVLWGCPLVFTIIYFVYILFIDTSWKIHPVTSAVEFNYTEPTNLVIKGKTLPSPLFKPILKLVMKLHPADIFTSVLCLCAIGLVIAPEIVYVKDIYSGDYKRANTMFKLTYQAFIMFGLSIGYILMRVGFSGMRPKRNLILKAILLIMFAFVMIYPFQAINSWYGFPNPAKYKGLDGLAFLQEKYPDDLKVIEWLNTNVKGNPSILEADGQSYSDNCRISMATGLPTIVGWFTHEHLWRNNPDIVSQKVEEVKQVYEGKNPEDTSRILKKYNIRYIIIGKIEREKFKALNEEKLLSLGSIAFDCNTTRIIKVY